MQMKLIEQVKAAIATEPLLAKEVLNAVAEGLEQYKQAEHNKRETIADDAVRVLINLGGYKSPHAAIPFLLSVAYIQFPTGLSNHSVCEVEFWKYFLKLARKEHSDDLMDWMRSVRGNHYFTWWQKYVLPEIKVKPKKRR